MNNLDKVKDRIAKLLAKANNNSNEHEAELAASRARALMDKYQLDEMDISVHAGVDLFGVEMSDEIYAYIPRWKDWLGVITAKFNDCQSQFMSLSKNKAGAVLKTQVWKGYKEDVVLAKQMYQYLCSVVDAATSIEQKRQGFTRYNARLGTIFKEAMVNRIYARMSEMMEARKEQVVMSNGTGLAIYKENQVAEHFGETTYKKSKQKDTSDYGLDEMLATVAGDRAGQEAAIIQVEGIEE